MLPFYFVGSFTKTVQYSNAIVENFRCMKREACCRIYVEEKRDKKKQKAKSMAQKLLNRMHITIAIHKCIK